MSQFDVGQTVRQRGTGAATLFEVVALPVPRNPQNADEEPGDPRMVVRYKDAPDQVRRVDPAQYEPAIETKIEVKKAAEPPKSREK
jgi:hypothetical protein